MGKALSSPAETTCSQQSQGPAQGAARNPTLGLNHDDQLGHSHKGVPSRAGRSAPSGQAVILPLPCRGRRHSVLQPCWWKLLRERDDQSLHLATPPSKQPRPLWAPTCPQQRGRLSHTRLFMKVYAGRGQGLTMEGGNGVN